MSKALEYLKAKEWEMGNGQCGDCCGVHEGWLGHPLHLDSSGIGHKSDCGSANAIRELGGNVIFIGEFKSDKIYEDFISDQGVYGTRLKTESGCPRIKEANDKFHKEMIKNLIEWGESL